MFSLSTKSKIFIAYIICKILVLFLGNKKRLILRNNIKYEIDIQSDDDNNSNKEEQDMNSYNENDNDDDITIKS